MIGLESIGLDGAMPSEKRGYTESPRRGLETAPLRPLSPLSINPLLYYSLHDALRVITDPNLFPRSQVSCTALTQSRLNRL